MIVTTRTIRQGKHNAQDWPTEYVCNFLEAGLVSYLDAGAGIAKLTKETIMSMLQSFVGKPVVIDHIDVTPKDFMNHAVGFITKVWFDDYSGWAYCSFILTDDKAKEKVQKGYSVSCAYDVLRTGSGGEWHAIKYDEEILEGSGTHLALVTSPRYEDCRIMQNSKQAKIIQGEGRKNEIVLTVKDKGKENKQKEDAKMKIQLFRKANDKAGAEVDPKDPTKQKWNADQLFVQVENEMVPLSELAKFADVKENEYVAIENEVDHGMEINGKVQNVGDLVAKYQASKVKNADEEEAKKKDMEAKKNAEEDEKKKKEEAENKKNAEDKEKEDIAKKNAEDDEKKKKDEEADAEKKIKENNKEKVDHFVKLNVSRQNGAVTSNVVIDTMHNRVDRGIERYGSVKK